MGETNEESTTEERCTFDFELDELEALYEWEQLLNSSPSDWSFVYYDD